jgi:WD40 repeat protein
MLVTGAIDASIKLWSMNDAALSSSIPITEIFEHDNAITCMATNILPSNNNIHTSYFLAAGAEDGTLIVWDIRGATQFLLGPNNINATKGNSSFKGNDMILSLQNQPHVCFSCQVSTNRKAITSVKWLPSYGSMFSTVGYAQDKVVCSSADGYLMCLDSSGRLVVASHVDSGILCMDIQVKRLTNSSDNNIINLANVENISICIFGGCADGSLRVWCMENNAFVEKCKYAHAHRVQTLVSNTSVILLKSVSVVDSLSCLVTGGDDGSIRVWSILSV